jgi:hypothetical protein
MTKANMGMDKNKAKKICIGVIKVRLVIPGNPINKYQYNTSTIYYTTNEFY